MATVLLFDREDALHFPTTRADLAAFTLTPSAEDAARALGLALVVHGGKFAANGHARCVAAGKRAVRDFDRGVTSSSLPTSIIVMARQSVWGHASLVHRLKLTLPPGPWIVRSCTGEWVEAHDWQTLHQVFLPRIWDSGLAHRLTASRPPFPSFFNWLNYLLALVARRRPGPWIASSSHKLKNGLQEGLADFTNLAVIRSTAGNWSDYRSLFRAVRNKKSPQTFRIPPLAIHHPDVKTAFDSLQRIGMEFSDPRVRSAWQAYLPYLAKTIPVMLGIVDAGPTLLRRIGVRAAVNYESNSWIAASLMEAASSAGVKRVIFNHNSHPPSVSPIANSVIDTLLRQRTWNELTDVAAVWSPFSLMTLRDLAGVGRQERILPVRLAYPSSINVVSKARPLRILHAGNYQNWSDFFPWVAETADEYLSGVGHLATVVEQMEGVELVIRVRPKLEVDMPTVERSLGKRRNVTVCSTEQDFLVQLSESDLLVAHFSTTVEQALQMGKPVLLWGSTNRYCQFQGQESPPEGRLTSLIYIARKASALPGMLAGIRDALQDENSEASPSAYAFEAGTSDVADLASFLIDPTSINQELQP